MKKILLFLTAIFLTITSCSSNQETTIQTPKLPIKKTFTKTSPPYKITEDYNYDADNKLSSITYTSDNNSKKNTNYMYNGKKLERIEWFNKDNILTKRVIIEYAKDNVSKAFYYGKDGLELVYFSEFEYNSNLKLSKVTEVHEFNGHIDKDITLFEYLPNNTIKETYKNSSINKSSYRVITFDNKNNPFSKIPSFITSFKTKAYNNTNNRILQKEFHNGSLTQEFININTYDNEGFLIKSESGDNNKYTTEYTYNK